MPLGVGEGPGGGEGVRRDEGRGDWLSVALFPCKIIMVFWQFLSSYPG